MSLKALKAICADMRLPSVRVAKLALLLALAGSPALAQGAAGPPSVRILQGTPLSPASAAASSAYSGGMAHTNGLCRDYASNADICPGGARPRDPEIRALAAGLKNDPDLIYEYVRNSVETEFIFGSNKGPLGVIINKSGSAFDQAYLMVELLRQAGYATARYKFGTISLSGDQFYDWTGVRQAKAACAFLAAGGVPATINNVSSTCELGGDVTNAVVAHVWVQVNIGGQNYLFDPAYKPHSHKAAFDVRGQMQFSSGTPLSIASQTVAASGAGIANFDQANLATTLNTYASRLAARFEQADMAGGGLADAIGGEIIVPAVRPVGGLRQTSLSYATETQDWADIPDAYRAKLTVQRRNDDGSLTTYGSFFPDEIFGRRLEIGTIQGDGAPDGVQPRKPELRLDGVPIFVGTNFRREGVDNPWWSYAIKLRIALDHPFAQAAYGDDAYEREITGINPVHVMFGVGEVSKTLGEKWAREQAGEPTVAMEVYGCSYDDESPTGQCSFPYGQVYRANVASTWMAQQARTIEIHARLAGAKAQILHNLGAIYGVQGFSLGQGGETFTGGGEISDITSSLAMTSLTSDPAKRRAALQAVAATMAALEGSVPEQLSDLVDTASTARRFAWGNTPEAGETYSTAKRPFTHIAAYGTAPADASFLYEGSAAVAGSPTAGLRNALNSYLSQGFEATLSLEAALGPGYRTIVQHAGAYQRGGAFVATRYDAGGDPTDIAHVDLSFFNQTKGGGGVTGVGLSEAASKTLVDTFKDRTNQLGVNALTGLASYSSQTLFSVGQGEAPMLLSDGVGLRGGSLTATTMNGTTVAAGNWNFRGPSSLSLVSNNLGSLMAGNSAFDAMGDSRLSATAETLAAFVAMQDIWSAAPSTQRDVAGLLATDWWTRSLLFNTVTVSQGAASRRFVKVNGLGFREVSGGGATLTYAGARTPVRLGPVYYGREWDPERVWSYTDATLTEADKTVKTYAALSTGVGYYTSGREAMLSSVAYAGGIQQYLSVRNTALVGGRYRKTTYLVSTTGAEIPIADPEFYFDDYGQTDWEGTGDPTPTYWCFSNETGGTKPQYVYRTVTDAANQTYKLRFTTAIPRSVNRRPEDSCRLDAIFAPSDQTTPKIQYVYDDAGHVIEARDALAIRQPAARDAYRFYVAEGYRGEWANPTGAGYVVETMPAGGYLADTAPATSLTRITDELGRVNLALYDGRGRLISRTNPDKDKVLFSYDERDNVIKLRQIGKPSPFAALPERVITAGWNQTWNKIAWIKDANNAQTDFAYYDTGDGAGKLRQVTQPAVDGGQPVYTMTYYANGLLKTSTDPTGVVTNFTYDAKGNPTQSLVDPTGKAIRVCKTFDAIGNIVGETDPRAGVCP